MIVELSAHDVLRISGGEEVQVGGVTVRLSMSLTESVANGVESLPRVPQVGDTANVARTGAPIFRMHAKFNGRCHGCKVFLKQGGPIIRDTVHKRTLCMACGEPVLAAFEAETRTRV